MDNWYGKSIYEAERIKDLRREAAEYRLVREAESASRRPGFFWKWLYNAGAWLSDLGCRIERKYMQVLASSPGSAGSVEMSCRCA